MDFSEVCTTVVALVCVGCGGDDSEDTGAGTESATQSDDSGTATVTVTADDDGSTSVSTDGSSSGHAEESESSGHGHDTTVGHDTTGGSDTTAAHDSGSTGETVCDVLGEGCHDNKTPEGIECHLVGHDGDIAACEKVYDACAEICGL